MTTKLQRAINIATTPSDNARLILNDERAQRERRICHENSEGERMYSDVLSVADYAVFNAVACRCRSEFKWMNKAEKVHRLQIELIKTMPHPYSIKQLNCKVAELLEFSQNVK